MQYKVMVSSINGDGANFHEIFCGHKSEIMRYMGLKICMGDKTHRYYKCTKFRQNPRGDPKFLIWNNPYDKIFVMRTGW